MVNDNNEEKDLEVEITNEETTLEEPEIIEEEARSNDKIKQQRAKLAELEDEKRQLQDELQRAKADFLNARKRLEEERVRDRIRAKREHVEELLPLCDSFQMAMQDKDAWEKADASWRKGVEGIHAQLMNLLKSYDVMTLDPVGEPFDHHKHEAIGTEKVDDESRVDTVVSVVQKGYEMKIGEQTELVRPARVTTGTIE